MKTDREFFIKLDYGCDNNCIFCSMGGREGSISFKEIENLIKGISVEDYSVVSLSGGEITLREDFLEIIKLIKDLGFKINLQTHGQRFSDEEFVLKVINIGIEDFLISFHSADKRNFEKITRKSGSFESTVAGIKKLRKYNQHVTVNTVVCRENFRDILDIAKVVQDLDVRLLKLVLIRSFGRARHQYLKLCPKFSDIYPFLYEALKVFKNEKLEVVTEGFPFCKVDPYFSQVAELQEPNYSHFVDEHYNNKNFAEYERENYRSKQSNCQHCLFDNFCSGPWTEYLKLYPDEELMPILDRHPFEYIDQEILLKKLFFEKS